jgi:4-alpha-glucanotransferase
VSRISQLFEQRRAGVLLHPSSLPSPFSHGDIGVQAHHFVNFLADCGFRVWQMLPIGPTHSDGSPYQLLSVHAGSPELIDVHWLQQQQLISDAELDQATLGDCAKSGLLKLAAKRFAALLQDQPESTLAQDFVDYCRDNSAWLNDFALFMALREQHGQLPWHQWPPALCRRQPQALVEAGQQHSERIESLKFEQFVFALQWRQLRQYTHERGIALFGDMPIFVHLDSADVWADQPLFRLDKDGQPLVVTGVPPDYFSVDGQRWGNPHYDWRQMEAQGFNWWIQRVATQRKLFDLIRIDHFRGFEACWEIAADVDTAIDGKWVKAPGEAVFKAIAEACGDVPFVAENLGLITPEVEQLRGQFGLPGMLILQFAFDGSADNPYLPHSHHALEVVYTGTHDNDTAVGWYNSLDEMTRARVYEYLGSSSEPMPWLLIRAAFASVAGLAMVPMQDLLGLDSAHRMNVPGTTVGNWGWRFSWDSVTAELPGRLYHMLSIYNRLPASSGID